MKVVTPAQIVVVEYICDKCEKGKMVQRGHPIRTEIPYQYPHQCDNCSDWQFFDEPPYPRLLEETTGLFIEYFKIAKRYNNGTN